MKISERYRYSSSSVQAEIWSYCRHPKFTSASLAFSMSTSTLLLLNSKVKNLMKPSISTLCFPKKTARNRNMFQTKNFMLQFGARLNLPLPPTHLSFPRKLQRIQVAHGHSASDDTPLPRSTPLSIGCEKPGNLGNLNPSRKTHQFFCGGVQMFAF